MIDFFAERTSHLLNGKLREILQRALFEPRAFSATALAITEIPLRPKQRHRLGTPMGLASHELMARPAVVLESLRRLCVNTLDRAVGGYDNSYVEVLLFLIRISTTMEAQALAMLDEQLYQGGEAHAKTAQKRLEPLVRNLRNDFMLPASQLLGHWLAEVSSSGGDGGVQLSVICHAHLVLLHCNLHRGWKVFSDNELRHSWPPIAALPSMAVCSQWAVGALRMDVEHTNWKWSILGGSELLPSVFATMQESRSEMLHFFDESSATDSNVLYAWLERTVAVGLRRQSGGEPFDPKFASPAQAWARIGSAPLVRPLFERGICRHAQRHSDPMCAPCCFRCARRSSAAPAGVRRKSTPQAVTYIKWVLESTPLCIFNSTLTTSRVLPVSYTLRIELSSGNPLPDC